MTSAAQDTAPADLRVGVIGVGQMGADHVARISRRIKGARVSVVTDYFRDKAEEVAATAPGCRVVDSPEELIAADDVDAVLIASPGTFHRDQAIACIEAGKPVLCEKPLAMNPEDAYAVVEAEKAGGAPLVSLGFMRRFDAGYADLKDAIAGGELGQISMLHCKHRNATTLPGFSDTMMVYDSAVHEVDAIHYFLEEEIEAVQVVFPTPGPRADEGQHDPMLLLFRTASGVIVTDELYVNTDAGYEVRTEAIGSKGIATIGLESGRVTTHLAGARWGGAIPKDFRPRFIDAYDAEVQAWVAAVQDGTNIAERSATSWDGYLGAAACQAAEKALTADGFVPVTTRPRP
ncbi:Gfo/Idh/MocA family protein [Brachybacterium saurashtrense]|uniref:Gfo/Idh/MocA family oxidoreductase n=1 Tax=Brachybacterium saurashtrense TaxID=556288 RepID=A0A345YS13_9MICO|nr:Gfo/Idh/MocA family oxidoreductase [Brachybacterium saurashtrense]AXK46715.1 gfo/Idh/MocA family oxidoreductase [Brachybacterium saurashtrense]RRR22429.1 gfo/Idh/MocA family oxidoreductase [Brachybacterium saurashtrense]